MEYLNFDLQKGIIYNWCGKFISPNPEWTHMTRALTDYEFILVTEGILGIADESRDFTVLPGEFLIMSPTTFQHGIRNGNCSFYWMHFSAQCLAESRLSPVDSSGTGHTLILPRQSFVKSPERIIILLKQLMDSDRSYKNPMLNQALCTAVLGEVSCQCCSSQSLQTLSREQLLEDICNYISWHAGEELTISQIADYFGYNEKYLTTLFRRNKGLSLKQFVLETKMERAKFALSETNQTISQIAYGLGFKDVHNFSNAFKKKTDFSPSQYRQSYHKHNVFDK